MPAQFRVFLIGTPLPLQVELEASDARALEQLLLRSRFVVGRLTETDDPDCCADVLIPVNRIHLMVLI